MFGDTGAMRGAPSSLDSELREYAKSEEEARCIDRFSFSESLAIGKVCGGRFEGV